VTASCSEIGPCLENASLEDSRTTLVDTIERSTPESEADRSNIIETRYDDRSIGGLWLYRRKA